MIAIHWAAGFLAVNRDPLPPRGHIWDVLLVWRNENIKKTISVLQYCVPLWWCTKVRAVLQVGRLYRALILLGLALCFPSASVSSWLHSFLCHLASWACWNWPLTWFTITNHCTLVLWHCWLCYMTRKIVSKMTYNVSSATLNPTVLYSLWYLEQCIFSCHNACYVVFV